MCLLANAWQTLAVMAWSPPCLPSLGAGGQRAHQLHWAAQPLPGQPRRHPERLVLQVRLGLRGRWLGRWLERRSVWQAGTSPCMLHPTPTHHSHPHPSSFHHTHTLQDILYRRLRGPLLQGRHPGGPRWARALLQDHCLRPHRAPAGCGGGGIRPGRGGLFKAGTLCWVWGLLLRPVPIAQGLPLHFAAPCCRLRLPDRGRQRRRGGDVQGAHGRGAGAQGAELALSWHCSVLRYTALVLAPCLAKSMPN